VLTRLRLGFVRQGERVAFVAWVVVEQTGHVVPSRCRPTVKRPLPSLGAGPPPLVDNHHHFGLRPSLLLAFFLPFPDLHLVPSPCLFLPLARPARISFPFLPLSFAQALPRRA